MREGNSAAVIESVMRNPSVLDSSRIKNKTSGNTCAHTRMDHVIFLVTTVI